MNSEFKTGTFLSVTRNMKEAMKIKDISHVGLPIIKTPKLEKSWQVDRTHVENHGASTIVFHLSLTSSSRLASPHDIRIDLNSAPSALIHWSSPSPLALPWGFQSSAFFVMFFCGISRMCPIQHHFRSFMVWTIGAWLVFLQISMLAILFGHLMFKIWLRHLLKKTTHLISDP